MIGQGSGSGEKPVKILAAVFARGCYVEGRMKQIAIFNQNLVLSGKRYKRERERERDSYNGLPYDGVIFNDLEQPVGIQGHGVI